MCHYITATLPKETEPTSVAETFRAHQFGFKLISNPHVARQIEAGDWYVLTTKAHCDCGTALGSFAGQATTVRDYQSELKKFRKQNWSEAKIRRWLEQKEQTRTKHQREDEARTHGGPRELTQWIELIADLFKLGQTRRIGLLLHWYRGDVESEPIEVLRREKVRMADLSPDRLLKMQEDVVYEVLA